MNRVWWTGVVYSLLLLVAIPARSEEATIAVAANFRDVALQIARAIEAESDHRYQVISGSTGALYTQIRNSAPFDVFLAADLARPTWLFEEGMTTADGVRVYAVGQLALWRPALSAGKPDDVIANPQLRRIAMANPQLAPYGAAAEAYLESTGLMEGVRRRLVMAGNVSATYSLVATGNADIGLVAASTLREAGVPASEYDLLPHTAYPPIEQSMVLLLRGKDNAAARHWFEWLQGPDMVPLLEQAGYRLPTRVAAE